MAGYLLISYGPEPLQVGTEHWANVSAISYENALFFTDFSAIFGVLCHCMYLI
jgi:hypothetical protein